MALWDNCAEHRALVNNVTAENLFQLQGRTHHEAVFGEEGDITALCQFEFYEWGYYRKTGKKNGFPPPMEMLGRVLGPTRHVGNEMAQDILPIDRKVLPRHTVR